MTENHFRLSCPSIHLLFSGEKPYYSLLTTHFLIMELSYFKLLLTAYLKESYPEKADNHKFIHQRSELATENYAWAITSGYNHIEAAEQASIVLYRNLRFSKYNILFEILSEEFTNTVAEEQIAERALELLPLCADTFTKYDLGDDFADTPEYEKLYTELTGKLAGYGI